MHIPLFSWIYKHFILSLALALGIDTFNLVYFTNCAFVQASCGRQKGLGNQNI